MYLCLNATKTKDTCINFRKYPPSQSDTSAQKLTIGWSGTATAVSHTTNISSVFTASENLAPLTLIAPFCLFYKSCILSVLTFSFMCWFGKVSQKDKNKLQRVVNISSKISGFKLSSLTALYEKQVLHKANNTINDNTHIL